MEIHIETMKRTVELAATCQEGIVHIKARLNEGSFEDTMNLFGDVVEAYSSMEASIQSFSDQLHSNQIEERSLALRNALNHVVSTYEQGNRGKVLEIIQFNLQPSFEKWKAEVEQALTPYLVS